MPGPRRWRYDDREVDAYVAQQQERRRAERIASGDWEYVEDEFSHLFGPVLVRKRLEQTVD